MLLFARHINELSVEKLNVVYRKSNQQAGAKHIPMAQPNAQQRYGEQAFAEYLQDVFFRTKDAVYCIWVEEDFYMSALRLEPYEDGLLLAGLETVPEKRRQGYAEKLVSAVLTVYADISIYSHIDKRNLPSVRLHEKCGFRKICDYARLIDGTVSSNGVTYAFISGKNRTE